VKLKEKKVKITEIKKRRVKERVDMRYIKSFLALSCLLAVGNASAIFSWIEPDSREAKDLRFC